MSRSLVVVAMLATVSCSAFGADDSTPSASNPAPTAPVSIATGVSVSGLIASADRLAWVTTDKLWIKRGSEQPYEAMTAPMPPATGHMAVHGDTVFFANGSVTTSCAMTGGPCPVDGPMGAKNAITVMAVRGDDLMVVNVGTDFFDCHLPTCQGGTLVATLGGTATSMVATTGATIVGVALGAQDTSLVKYVGSTPSVLANNIAALTGLATDGITVYWTDAGLGTVRACAVAGCPTPQDLAKGRVAPTAVAVNDGHLYWLEPDVGNVMRCTLPACTDAAVLTTAKKPKLLAVGDRVYFTSEEDRAIYAVPK